MEALQKVFKKVLDNGLTILVRATHHVPKVSTQLWYNVGSKDEQSGEKGIAHLIEHMIFKGTRILSESDINMITQKLSGTCNAFTSYDYTGYLFDFPSHHWQEALPIMADCMQNCTFKQELLNSEMKAVIQELKMYRDNYSSSIIEKMISNIFADHPYHYPIIGFKHDLWDLKSETLHAFYKKHYIPNNATLVVVGDVVPEEVFALAQAYFGTIPADWNYTKTDFHHGADLSNTTVTMYRDIKQPIVMLAFEVPGARSKNTYMLDVLSWLIGSGKGSRLQKKLIDELQLVVELETFSYDLFDRGLFFIYFQPHRQNDIQKIIELIHAEMHDLATAVIPEIELTRAIKQTQAEYLSILENNQKQAYIIGQTFLATQDENYLFEYLNYPVTDLIEEIKRIVSASCKPSLTHQGYVLPLNPHDEGTWAALQEQSDIEDEKVLSGITRATAVEAGAQVHVVQTATGKGFIFPKPTTFTLPNGLSVIFLHNPNIGKIHLSLEFKAKSNYDPEALQGLLSFMNEMLLEGTHTYNAIELAQAIEARGMNIDVNPGYVSISMLSIDLAQGLHFLLDILTHATFEPESITKIRAQLLADLQNYWDDPAQFVGQLTRQALYKNHPNHKNWRGNAESIRAITREDIIACYKKYITPQETTLVLVGDLHQYNVQELLMQHMGSWQGPAVESLEFPRIAQPHAQEIVYPINRDQIVLAFAGISVSRFDKYFDALLIFDQIFTGGVLGSMSSRLFDLRERSGLFYTIGGSLLANADEQPGMVFIRTIVSKDRLQEAEKAIKQVIMEAAETITQEEVNTAKDALIHAAVNNFESNKNTAFAFLFLKRYHLPYDYFDHRSDTLRAITVDTIKAAVSTVLNMQHIVTLKVGRL